MLQDSYDEFLAAITRKIAAEEEEARSLEHARNTSEGKMQSRYDTQKEIFAQEHSIKLSVLEQSIAFRSFLEGVRSAGPLERTRVELGAEMDIQLLDARDRLPRALFAPVTINLGIPGLQILTPQTPIGKVISGHEAGNTFVYTMSRKPLEQLTGKDYLAGIIHSIR